SLQLSPRVTRPPLPPSFFSTDPAPTDIYTLSLHDALPIYPAKRVRANQDQLRPAEQERRHPAPAFAKIRVEAPGLGQRRRETGGDRKSTRLNSSHVAISYAVFCLKKKKEKLNTIAPKH